MLIFILLVPLVVFFYIDHYRRLKNGPPGPFPLPILGNLIQLSQASKVPHLALSEIAKSYGEILKIKVGFKDIVILSSYDAISEVFCKDEALGRDVRGSLHDRQNGYSSGILMSEGEVWEKTRKWSVRNLRNFGLGRTSVMQQGIEETITEFIKNLETSLNSGNDILNVSTAFAVPTTELAWKMIVGHYTPEDKVLMTKLIKGSEAMARAGVLGAGITNAFPFLRFLFPNWTGHNIHMDFYKACRAVANEILQDGKKQWKNSKETPQSLTDAYVRKLNVDGPDDAFSDYHYETLFMDFLQASSESTASYLEALCLFMVLYPEVQAKVYKEIQERIRSGLPAQFEDRESMIYTQAVFLEVHRHAKIIQNLVPRKALSSFYYKNYFIPKGTSLLADLQSAFNDKRIFEDPEAFNPSRFINDKGDLVNTKYIIPLSIGKRNCPGEPLSEVTSFMFFIRLLQKFQLSLIPGEKRPAQEMNAGFTSRPFPFKIQISKR